MGRRRDVETNLSASLSDQPSERREAKESEREQERPKRKEGSS